MTRESDPECQFAGLYGLPVRGRAVEIDLQGSKFSSEGDIFLFGTVLSHFFSQYASMNSVVGLKVSNLTTGSVYQWPPRSGEERLI
jgi:type VI secretion system protein ImpG